MRVAVLSDVHGNVWALEAVLEDIARQDVEKILNLGDHFAGPLEPVKTARMLANLDMVAIQGNTDRYLIDVDPDHLEREERETVAALEGAPMEWLKSLSGMAIYRDAILMSHGSPQSDEVYWLDRKDRGQGFRASTEDEIRAELPARQYPIYCCGHTHIARVVTLSDGRIVFNPGSVGRPSFNVSDPESAVRLSPEAAYAIVEQTAGRWHVDLRQVPYDHEAAAAMARERGFKGWAHDLAHGRKR